MYHEIERNKKLAVLYILLFLTVWIGIGALVGLVVSLVTQPTYGPPRPATGDIFAGMVIAGFLALCGTFYSLSSGDKLVLRVAGARPADPRQHLQLINVVQALAIGDGLPCPAIYVIDDPSPNAFATGISPKKASITATTGLLAIMNREELEGVIGHEMSHIKNYDVRLLLIVSTLIGMAALVASVIWRSAFIMGRGRNGAQLMLVIFAAGLLFGIVAFFFGPIVRLALSRRREELADVSSCELTRNPAGLISALRKLEQNDKPFKNFNHATAAMCIDDPLQHHEKWYHRLYDTHPPIEQRIAVLERVALGKAV